MSKKSDWIYIVLLVLAAPLLLTMGRSTSTAETNRKLTNRVGFLALAVIMLLVLVVGTWRWFDVRHAIAKTQQDLKALAVAVAESEDGSVILDWAAGKHKDAWGNTFLLQANDEYVQFSSKGPDGKQGTKDDILGVSFEKVERPPWKPRPEDVKVEIEEIKEEAEGLWGKARDWFRDKAD